MGQGPGACPPGHWGACAMAGWGPSVGNLILPPRGDLGTLFRVPGLDAAAGLHPDSPQLRDAGESVRGAERNGEDMERRRNHRTFVSRVGRSRAAHWSGGRTRSGSRADALGSCSR